MVYGIHGNSVPRTGRGNEAMSRVGTKKNFKGGHEK